MKLIKDEFENYAIGQGYERGEELFEYLGGNINSYRRYRKQIPIMRWKNSIKDRCSDMRLHIY